MRILWREIKGKRRWYVQLINEGLPYQKPTNYVSDGLVGLDLNVSNIAFVADKQAGLLPFAENVSTYQKELILNSSCYKENAEMQNIIQKVIILFFFYLN